MANLNNQEEAESSSSTTSNTQRLEQYITDKRMEYLNGMFDDETLWMRLQEDFEEWTDEQLATVRKSSLNGLRYVLRLRGVWVATSRDVTGDLIHVIRQEERTQWTDAEIFEFASTTNQIKSPYLNRRQQLRD